MKKTIITVDDSISMRQIVSTVLGDAGYQVVDCVDGAEALAQIQKRKVDMMITDLNMPKMDGIQLISAVRAIEGYKYIPIVMLTTESAVEKKQAGKLAGASGWIVKPFRPDQLVSVVERLLGKN